MENILQSLHDLEGVHGAIVTDSSGQLVAHRAHSMYEVGILQQVGRGIAGAIDAIKLVQEDWESITTHFSEGKLLIRNLAPGANGLAFTLTLIADARLNPSFATVAIRVAMGKLKAVLSAGPERLMTAPAGLGNASASSPRAAPAAASSSLSRSGAGAFSQAKAPMTEVANSGLSWSGFGSSVAASGSGVAVADATSSAMLTACTKALARNVGPMAKLFVKDAVRKISPDQPFSKDSIVELIAELAKNIENPAAAALFQKNLLKAL